MPSDVRFFTYFIQLF